MFANVDAGIVGEDEEVSIKEVADAIVKAVGYEGDYRVRYDCPSSNHQCGETDRELV